SDDEVVGEMKEELEEYEEKVEFVEGEVRKKEDLKKMVEVGREGFGGMDGLIKNGGGYIFERKKLADYCEEEWYEMM
ncbi:SDR family NAD(P)-dependent oxidoreductase, partial [Bacillus pumilus]|uniref:SDR family NAD(P)-dependent oxidoreductase n=1 Tax=Bacillus pumilus TaxID=1408 RepID=UPI0011A4A3E6